MVANGEYLLTAEENKQRRMEAVYAHETAKDARARLILDAKTTAKRLRKIAALLEAIEPEPEFPLQSESGLLLLTPTDYDGADFVTVRALANAIAASRKTVADTAENRRISA